MTTTPRPMRLLERIRKDAMDGDDRRKDEGQYHAAEEFIEVMMATYGGTRIGRQELDGELMAEAEGSLFPRALLEGCRSLSP